MKIHLASGETIEFVDVKKLEKDQLIEKLQKNKFVKVETLNGKEIIIATKAIEYIV